MLIQWKYNSSNTEPQSLIKFEKDKVTLYRNIQKMTPEQNILHKQFDIFTYEEAVLTIPEYIQFLQEQNDKLQKQLQEKEEQELTTQESIVEIFEKLSSLEGGKQNE